MRPAVHPDRALRVPCEMLDVDRDELLRRRVDLVPHADVGEAVRVVRRMHAALIIGQREDRRAPALRARAVGGVERQPGVVAELGTRQAGPESPP